MNNSTLKPVVILGGGGHASVLVDILRAQGRKIKAIVCPDSIAQRGIFAGILHLKQDDDVLMFSTSDVLLVNGIGMLPKSSLKRKVNEYFLNLGYQFETVVSDDAFVSPFAKLSPGSQVFSGAIIQAGATVGEHCIINSGSIVEHDCSIGVYNHIAPGATLCGQVVTEDDVYVGANATVIQNVKLAQGSIVGAGSVVTQSLLSKQVCYPNLNTIKGKA